MPIHPTHPKTIQKAAELLQDGSVVAFPTETVYGLGADALNAKAVAQIFEIKNRPHFDPLIVHIAEWGDLEKLAHVTPLASKLAKKFWPGPLTLVLKKKPGIPELVVSGLDTVAVRMPNHPVALELIRLAKTPVAAPSANPFGYLSPTTAAHVDEQLGTKIEMILDGGACGTGVESTIIDCSQDKPRLLRPGGCAIEELEKLVGALEREIQSQKPDAPGQLEQHYSPRKPLRILPVSEMRKDKRFSRAGVLLLKPKDDLMSATCVEVLSTTGDLKEAAMNFFAALHRLDQCNVEIIFAEPLPEMGLGHAMMDRLRRAAATFVN